MFRYGQVNFSGVKFFHLRRAGGRSDPSVNLGPLISRKVLEIKKLKFYIPLDRAKYSFQV